MRSIRLLLSRLRISHQRQAKTVSLGGLTFTRNPEIEDRIMEKLEELPRGSMTISGFFD